MNEINLNTSSVQNAQPVRQKKSKLWLVLLIFALVLLCCAVSVFLIYAVSLVDESGYASISGSTRYATTYGETTSANKILTIAIKGPILNEGSSQSFDIFGGGYVYGYEIKRQLIEAAEDSSIKAVMLEIDSPGGTITGSQAISDGVAYYKEKTNNPVYAHIMGVGASGGYWSAASADKIFADNGSLIGSIGVIFGPFKYYQDVTGELSGLEAVTTEGGIETYYITSGYYKDFGNPYRPMSGQEMQSMQADTDLSYEKFVSFVSQSRNITTEKIKNVIKALPYGEQKSLELGLIDKIADEGAAYYELAEAAGISEDYQVVEQEIDVDFWSMLFYGKLLNASTSEVKMDYCKELCGKMLYLYGDPQLLR